MWMSIFTFAETHLQTVNKYFILPYDMKSWYCNHCFTGSYWLVSKIFAHSSM